MFTFCCSPHLTMCLTLVCLHNSQHCPVKQYTCLQVAACCCTVLISIKPIAANCYPSMKNHWFGLSGNPLFMLCRLPNSGACLHYTSFLCILPPSVLLILHPSSIPEKTWPLQVSGLSLDLKLLNWLKKKKSRLLPVPSSTCWSVMLCVIIWLEKNRAAVVLTHSTFACPACGIQSHLVVWHRMNRSSHYSHMWLLLRNT